jgi:hypothetical protein
MNQKAAEALYRAKREGVRQIKNFYWDGLDGYCALGVIHKELTGDACNWITAQRLAEITEDEAGEIATLSDRGMTFGEIARKFGPDHA